MKRFLQIVTRVLSQFLFCVKLQALDKFDERKRSATNLNRLVEVDLIVGVYVKLDSIILKICLVVFQDH